MPNIGCPKIFGPPNFKGDKNLSKYGMISLNNVNGNHMEMRRFSHMLEIDIFRNSSQKDLGVLMGAF